VEIVFLSDIHVRQSRLALQADILARTVQRIREVATAPEGIFIGGDLAGISVPHRATPAERNALTEFFLDLSQIADVLIVRGNHDEPGDWHFLNAIDGLRYIEEPALVSLASFHVVVLPWIDRSRATDFGWPHTVRTALVDTLQLVPTFEPCVVLAHIAEGSTSPLGPGQPKIPTEDPKISLDAAVQTTGITPEVAFLGHYHQPQLLPTRFVRAVYGGSLFVNGFGEDAEKGFWHYSSGELAFHRIDQPARYVATVDADGRVLSFAPPLPGGEIPSALSAKSIPAGSALKIALVGAEHDLPALAKQADALKARLSRLPEVKIAYEVERPQREREGAADVTEARTVAEKVKAWLSSLDPQPAGEDVAGALALLARVEDEDEG